MPATRQQKELILKDLTEKFKNAKSVVAADYKGVKVKELQSLRKDLKSTNGSLKISKKTLMKLALKENGYPEIPTEIMEGPVALAFSEDEISAAKTLYNFATKNPNLKLLGGFMDGEVLNLKQVIELAKIPGKLELYAKMLGSMQSPVYGFHAVLNGLMRNFVYVLSAISKLKPKEEAVSKTEPAEETEEQPKETKEKAEAPKEAAPKEEAKK